MSLRTTDLSVHYGKVRALEKVSLELSPGEMFFLLGPSGCGKSSLLRAVAGFIEDYSGELTFGGQSLRGVPAHRRDFGMVFQNYALFPHLTVAGNVAFGLEARKTAAAETARRVTEALALVGLTGLEARRPGELSGGQQQRVALARALVIRPRLLLLDEPLSNLDAKLRWEMRGELRRLHRELGLTTLYVTHDQKEALSLADRLAVLREGRLEAVGRPRELYRDPPNRFVAEFLGELNRLRGVLRREGKGWRVVTALGAFEVPEPRDGRPKEGAEVEVFCRPEDVRLEAETGPREDGAAPLAAAEVRGCAFLGEQTLYDLELPGEARWRCLRQEGGEGGFAEGAQARVAVRSNAWRLLL